MISFLFYLYCLIGVIHGLAMFKCLYMIIFQSKVPLAFIVKRKGVKELEELRSEIKNLHNLGSTIPEVILTFVLALAILCLSFFSAVTWILNPKRNIEIIIDVAKDEWTKVS